MIFQWVSHRIPRQSAKLGSLSWLSWIVSRLGGWNCYYSPPPGPKTMARGWQRLAEMLDGFTLAQELQHV
jgi:hypothetical protein